MKREKLGTYKMACKWQRVMTNIDEATNIKITKFIVRAMANSSQ